MTVAKLVAPMMPFISEELYQNLVRVFDPAAPESVHLCDYPTPNQALIDEQLIADTHLAMRVVSLGHAARMKAGIKVRQPIQRALFKVRTDQEADSLKRLTAAIADELNTKEVGRLDTVAEVADYRVTAVPNLVGKKYGALFPKVRAALAQADALSIAQQMAAGETVRLTIDGQEVELLPEELQTSLTPREGYAVADDAGYIAAVTTQLTPELVREGLAREIVRRVQTMRKDADFRIQDNIVIYYQAGPAIKPVIETFGEYIRQETLATAIVEGAAPDSAFKQEAALDGEVVTLAVVRNR